MKKKKSDAEPALGLVLREWQFCSCSFGIQLPRYREIQAILPVRRTKVGRLWKVSHHMERDATWRKTELSS